jgi:exonuclease I
MENKIFIDMEQLNEIKRMQQLAGVVTESQINEVEETPDLYMKLKDLLYPYHGKDPKKIEHTIKELQAYIQAIRQSLS